VHSVLHEGAHFICMPAERRAGLDTDAGGDDRKRMPCAISILNGGRLPNVGSERMCRDMDEWGYTFVSAAPPLGSRGRRGCSPLVDTPGLIDAESGLL